MKNGISRFVSCLDLEKFAEQLNVSARSVSRWETGNNMPDIALLVEIADFYDVDVREIIEGEKKSEMMDDDIREVATKMADYAVEEKSKLLRRMQVISFIGVLVLVASIFLQTRGTSPEEINKGLLIITSVALVIMAINTLYVTGLLEKIVKHKRLMLGIKIATIVGVIAAIWRTIVFWLIIFVLFLDVIFSKPEVYSDITHYNEYMSFSRNMAPYKDKDYKWTKLGMDEKIWPKQITDSMNVLDYKMVYFNPWDAQYLGYLVVEYSPEDYAKEVERLKEYKSTEYIGQYGVTEEKTYELLAIFSDEYHGFVYALTDGKNKIIYAEELFCNHFMDLDYKKYIPEEYLLDGFDATSGNPYQTKYLENMHN